MKIESLHKVDIFIFNYIAKACFVYLHKNAKEG